MQPLLIQTVIRPKRQTVKRTSYHFPRNFTIFIQLRNQSIQLHSQTLATTLHSRKKKYLKFEFGSKRVRIFKFSNRELII